MTRELIKTTTSITVIVNGIETKVCWNRMENTKM